MYRECRTLPNEWKLSRTEVKSRPGFYGQVDGLIEDRCASSAVREEPVIYMGKTEKKGEGKQEYKTQKPRPNPNPHNKQ